MAFKSKYKGNSSIESPEALFYDLRNRKVPGPLAHQSDVLRDYKNNALKKPDVAMELPTGSGKTLIGLLVGEWRRRELHERVVYLCPTKQLVHQVVDEARTKFDIHPHAFTGSQRDYDPRAKAEYSQGEAIAVTTYSSLFNTNPFFYNPNFIVLDDAHAAENYIVKHWSLNISRYQHATVYDQFLEIIKVCMPAEQYQRMRSDSPTPNDKVWVEKIPSPQLFSLHRLIVPFLDVVTQGKKDLEHNWSVLRDHLNGCHLFISWNSILIRPIIPPSTTHDAFSHANQRLYMSATLGLGGELERITGRPNIHRIKAPKGWDKHGIGRRLFFFPGVTLKESECEQLVYELVKESPRALALVPDQQSADQLIAGFANETSKQTFQAFDIEQSKSAFISHPNAVAVLANRYDGINLADDECRLEIIQGLPSAANLHERFLESRMAASLLLKDRVRTRLVQAIGRTTRNATDYSAVCILGDDLQDRLLQKENIKLYHPELQAELLFGYEESKDAKGISDFIDMYRIFLCPESDEWRGADAEIVARRKDSEKQQDPFMDKLETAVAYELRYQHAMWTGDYQGALNHANTVASLLDGNELKGYRGFWFYLAGSAAWLAAQTDTSFYAIAKSRFHQAASCTSSVTWLRNLVEVDIKTPSLEENRHLSFLIERLELELERLGTTSERRFNKQVNTILEGLADNTEGNVFERAHEELGTLLGYLSGNSDENGAPDPWWIAGTDFCLVAEDYTATDGSKPISLHKVRQVTGHHQWISQNVPTLEHDTEYVRVIISPSTTIERAAVTYVGDTAYWNQQHFYEWANKALNVVRSLRLDFTGVGNERWRSKAMEAYRDAGIDPVGIKNLLSITPLAKLQQL